MGISVRGLQPADAEPAGPRAGLAKEPPGVSHLVAEVDGHGVVGWGELHAVYVRPEFMGAGVVRALLGAALDGLAALGHARGWRRAAPAR
ncbi:GNAT family N-acetyltransferase [Streptomyces millisiae]|uniref:N-acetyltransferase domain-containing protein n=1 Tax=Streptomyces millisiae TaxID=3075542 RepID=A0ABU2LRU1_9ACTN|nr:hypothetical protein [Streptomyces sp. DSM 44918]MDT0320266.1 hypothetical protein [Streptomyces sp. DSM 44918]